MSDRLQTVALIVSVALLLTVLELVRRKKLAEEYSFFWIGSALLLFALSAKSEMLRTVARWLGVDDPPLAVVVILVLIAFVASLWFSVIVSRQKKQIERLMEETAILSAEVREIRTGNVRLQPDRGDAQESAPNRPRV